VALFSFLPQLRVTSKSACAERGIVLTYETVRQWCLTFGQRYANELKRRRPKTGDKWHLDEVFLKINGKTHSLWRAVDQDGNVLDILGQSRRHKQAAKTFFRKLLKGLKYVPRVLITDKLASYAAAKRDIMRACRAPPAQGLEQVCGTFAPADPTTRANHAALPHHLATRNASSLPLVRSPIIFGPNDIVSTPRSLVPSCRIASLSGTR